MRKHCAYHGSPGFRLLLEVAVLAALSVVSDVRWATADIRRITIDHVVAKGDDPSGIYLRNTGAVQDHD